MSWLLDWNYTHWVTSETHWNMRLGGEVMFHGLAEPVFFAAFHEALAAKEERLQLLGGRKGQSRWTQFASWCFLYVRSHFPYIIHSRFAQTSTSDARNLNKARIVTAFVRSDHAFRRPLPSYMVQTCETTRRRKLQEVGIRSFHCCLLFEKSQEIYQTELYKSMSCSCLLHFL